MGRISGHVSARQERKSAKGNRFAFVAMSDPTGLYEVTEISETREAARHLLEPGTAVGLTVEATLEGETLKLLARGAQPVDEIAAAAGSAGLRIHLLEEDAAAAVAALFARVAQDAAQARSRGPVVLCIADRDTGAEVDLTVGESLPVGPQVKGAIKALRGVAAVEEL